MGKISKLISDLVLRFSDFVEENERNEVLRFESVEFSYSNWERLCLHHCGCAFPERLSAFLCFLLKRPYLYCIYAKVVKLLVYPQLRDAAVWYARGTDETIRLLHSLTKSGFNDRFTFMSMFHHWHSAITEQYFCKDLDKWIEDNCDEIVKVTERFSKVLDKQILERFIFGMLYEELNKQVPMQKMRHDVNSIIMSVLSKDYSIVQFQPEFKNRDYLLYVCEQCLPQLDSTNDVLKVKQSFDLFIEDKLEINDDVNSVDCRMMMAYANLIRNTTADLEKEIQEMVNRCQISYEGWIVTDAIHQAIKLETFMFGVVYDLLKSENLDPTKCESLTTRMNDYLLKQYHYSIYQAANFYRVSLSLAIYVTSTISNTELERVANECIKEIQDIYNLTYILSFTQSPYSDTLKKAFLSRYMKELPTLRSEWQGCRYENRRKDIEQRKNIVLNLTN